MEIFSPYIIAGLVAWAIAQLSKYVIASVKARSWSAFRQLYLSGNMPSGHSATIVAVTTVIGLRDGLGSGLFGLAVIVASVVIYDSVMVRRSSGEQGESLVQLIKEQKSSASLPRVAKGHTPLEAVVGSAIGLAVGIFVNIL